MAGVIFYKEDSWETYPGSKNYNFYIVAVDEQGEQIEHELNDWCMKPLPWRQISKTIKQRRAAFARLKINRYDANKRAMPGL